MEKKSVFDILDDLEEAFGLWIDSWLVDRGVAVPVDDLRQDELSGLLEAAKKRLAAMERAHTES